MFGYTSMLQATAILAILTTLIGASPAPITDTTNGVITAWGRFCNTLDCQGCGQWVDLANSNCLVENYRQAVEFKTDGPLIMGALISTPGDSCNCQSNCEPFNGKGCWYLGNATQNDNTHSYRFVNFGYAGKPCDGTVTNC